MPLLFEIDLNQGVDVVPYLVAHPVHRAYVVLVALESHNVLLSQCVLERLWHMEEESHQEDAQQAEAEGDPHEVLR